MVEVGWGGFIVVVEALDWCVTPGLAGCAGSSDEVVVVVVVWGSCWGVGEEVPESESSSQGRGAVGFVASGRYQPSL